MSFLELDLRSSILDYLKIKNIVEATDIQKRAIPLLLNKGHYMIQGVTGIGKTYAYLLPLFENLKRLEGDEKRKKASPRAIILIPTRELAQQIFFIAKELSHFAKLKIRKLVGGDQGKSLNTLLRSEIDILITTPDRCFRSLKNGELKKTSLTHFILDEADQLLDTSFQVTIAGLMGLLHEHCEQVVMVSATHSSEFIKQREEYFLNKKFQIIEGKGRRTLYHRVKTIDIDVEEKDKLLLLKEFIEKYGKYNGIIFTANKKRTEDVYEKICTYREHKIFFIHKDLPVKERKLILRQFIGAGGVIISTDVLARGIDIDHLRWVLNFDLPSRSDYYLHRVGRVGRNQKSGEIFNFRTPFDEERIVSINGHLKNQERHDLQLKSTFQRIKE